MVVLIQKATDTSAPPQTARASILSLMIKGICVITIIGTLTVLILEIPIGREDSLIKSGSAIRDTFADNDTASLSFTISVPDSSSIMDSTSQEKLNDAPSENNDNENQENDNLLESHATETAVADGRILRRRERRQKREKGKGKGGNGEASNTENDEPTGGAGGRDNQAITTIAYPLLRECIQNVLDDDEDLSNTLSTSLSDTDYDVQVAKEQELGVRHLWMENMYEDENAYVLNNRRIQTCDQEITEEMQGKVSEKAWMTSAEASNCFVIT